MGKNREHKRKAKDFMRARLKQRRKESMRNRGKTLKQDQAKDMGRREKVGPGAS